MPFLVRIGAIEGNVSGVGARGYVVSRAGRAVQITFGKVEAVGSGRTQFYWRRKPGTKTYSCRSIAAARLLVRSIIREQLADTKSGGYHRLPAGVRIQSASRRPSMQ